MANLKYSRQREAIKLFLDGRKDHPTAEAVYNGIRQEYPRVSLGTVYRNLRLLTELGEVRKISVGDGVEHFDYDTSPHSHFVCSCCNRVLDIKTDCMEQTLECVQKDFKGMIKTCSAVFYGVCEKCMKNS